MKYKLQGRNDISDIKSCILENRGIANPQEYMHLTDDVILSYNLLDNMDKAVELLDKHIQAKSNITILVDCDVDGQCSAAMMYMYIKNHLDKSAKVTYLLHSGKQHGLSEDIEIPTETGLLIIPDAGTNDTEQCKRLAENNIDVLILDHHEKEKENPYAVVVNNQCSQNYTNKEFCGTGIVYKFLQAYDDSHWLDHADDYLDLVALANISDVMDIRSYETKRIIDKGLSIVTNKCFEEFINAQNTSIKGKVNPHTVSFYITSLINAMCRVGDTEEKDLLFRAFIEQDEEFDYKKRGETETVKETIYQRAVRLCKNAKSRQDRQVNNILPDYEKKCSQDPNAVLFLKAKDTPSAFSGLVAMKLADKFKKPCLLLREINENETKKYRGSARNYDNSYIYGLKDFLMSTNDFNWCQGHQNAFGFEINASNVKQAIADVNSLCQNADSSVIVDFDMDYEDFDVSIISDVTALNDFYGTGIKEPWFYIRNITLNSNQGSTMGKDNSTWKFIDDDIDVAVIKFKNSSDDPVLNFLDSFENSITINALCQVEMSEFKGIITPQITIKEYEVVK